MRESAPHFLNMALVGVLLSAVALSGQTRPTGLSPSQQAAAETSEVQAPTREDATFQTLSRARRWNDVRELAEAKVLRDSTDTEALFWLGTARFQLGDATGSLFTLRSAQKLGMDTAELHIALGQAYYKLNQYSLFEEQMRLASRMDPKNGTPMYLRGFYRLSVKSDAGGALPLLQEAAKLQPHDAKILYELGYCLETSGRASEAKVSYQEAIDVVSKNEQVFAWPLQGMSRLLLNEDPQEALQFAKEAVAMQPGEATNHLAVAKADDRLGDLPDAVHEAREAAAESPTIAGTRYLLYRLYRRQGEAVLAEQELRIFEEINATYGPE